MRRLLLVLLLVATACGEPPSYDKPDSGRRRDASTDTGSGTEPDTGSEEWWPDVGPWIPPDAGRDAGPDAGADTGSGQPNDAGGDPCTGIRTIVALRIEPSTLKLDKGEQARIAVFATFDSGCVVNLTGSVDYIIGSPGIASVVEAPADPDSSVAGRAVVGLAKGSTTVVARSAGIFSEPVQITVTDDSVVPVPTETRGVWVTRFAFSGLDAVSGPKRVREIIDRAADNNFNAVFFQVRGVGDAYYRSSLVPSWKVSSGKFVADPGWDPLQVAVDEAKARGIQLHAYINALSGWTKTGTTPNAIPDAATSTSPAHILRQHPEWTCKDDTLTDSSAEYTYIAAEEGYRNHFVAVVEELLTRYPDLAGIHMDRIRTPGTKFCHSPGLDALYTQRYGTDKSHFAEFQREQVDKLVEAVYRKVVAKKPAVIVSASVWGIYKKLPGCSTSQGYYDYYQDSLGWTQKGIIDMLNPMIYWDLKPGSCTDWGALVDGFVAGANGRMIVAGMHALEGTSPDFTRIAARLAYARKKGIAGTVVFASAYLDQYSLWDDYKSGPFASPIGPTPIKHR